MLRVLNLEDLTENTFLVQLEGSKFNARAGQCFSVGLPGAGINREYSMYSGAQSPYLEFLIRIVEDGSLTPKLGKCQVGDYVEVNGPFGEFVIPDVDLERRHVFVATGTGIAPFHSMVKTYANLDYTVIHGVRFQNERYGSEDYKADRYKSCVSSSKAGRRVTDYLKTEPLDPNSLYYLCGNRNMIVESFETLRLRGVAASNIRTEVFF